MAHLGGEPGQLLAASAAFLAAFLSAAYRTCSSDHLPTRLCSNPKLNCTIAEAVFCSLTAR